MNLTQSDRAAIKELLKREPTHVELHIFDTMWSEHCSYKSSKETLKKYLPTKGSEVALGIGEDSGIVRFVKHNGKQYCVTISHESHNHPSQILPVEGAATGVGGVVRDVYCMGADVFGVLNSLHFGIDTTGKNPLVEEIAEGVVQGVCDYANPLGVPVLGGETLYHAGHNDNCLVNVAGLGLIEEEHIIHSFVPVQVKTEPYDVILFGKSTDATGFGGASFASATLDNENEASNVGAVQVHDPFLKRVTVEAIKHLMAIVWEEKIAIGFKDLGAGGIACATSEIAAASGYGVNVNLNKVNTALENLPAEVIACSETQERFCLAVPRSFSERVLKIFNEEFELPNLYHHAGAVVIGEVIQEPVYRLFHNDKMVCELPIQAITTEVKAIRTAEPRGIVKEGTPPPTILAETLKEICIKALSLPNNQSKRYVYRCFDNAVRGDTVVYAGETDAVVVTPIQDCNAAVAVSIDSNLYGECDPYVSGAAAVAESVRNLVAVGARPLALTDCLNYGNPEKPSVFFDFQEGVKGIGEAARALSFIQGEPIPIISGNVSFYNESKQGTAIVPSPVLLAVGRLEDYHQVMTLQLREPNLTLLMLGRRFPEFGGTQIQNLIPELNKVAPQVRYDEEDKQNKAVYALIQEGLIVACHDIAMGGLWQTLIEMVLGERGLFSVGLDIELSDKIEPITQLFSENGGYVIAVTNAALKQVETQLSQNQIQYQKIGHTTTEKQCRILNNKQQLFAMPLAALNAAWQQKNQQELS